MPRRLREVRVPRLLKHQLAWLMPLTVLAYGLTAPHVPAVSLLFLSVLVLAITLDFHASPDRTPPEALPAWPFDATIFGLSALHFLNLALLLHYAPGAAVLDRVIGVTLTGASAGYTAIVVAHELIHRPEARSRLLGRALLVSVLYEHFSTEHVRGHHVRVATDDDPATARYDEPFYPFLLRTVPAQLRSAWGLEARRVGRRWWTNRVLHGLVVEWAILLVVGLALGPLAAWVYFVQAAVAVLLLEAVNYIEHWGLRRAGKRVTTVDSWDAESWFTYYALVGLSRHADHHAHPARPYPELRAFEESPKLPWGYFGTVIATLFAGPVVRRRLKAELERKGLGPFASAYPEAAPAK